MFSKLKSQREFQIPNTNLSPSQTFFFHSHKTMAAISYRQNPHVNNTYQHKGAITEEIQGLIKVHRDGFVERPPIVPCVSCSSSLSVTSRDIFINKDTNLWARLYVPSTTSKSILPLLVYFHGGGFCVEIRRQ